MSNVEKLLKNMPQKKDIDSFNEEDIKSFNKELRTAVQKENPSIEEAQNLAHAFWRLYIDRFESEPEFDRDHPETWYKAFLEKANKNEGDPLLFLHPFDKELFKFPGACKESPAKYLKIITYSNALLKCGDKKIPKNGLFKDVDFEIKKNKKDDKDEKDGKDYKDVQSWCEKIIEKKESWRKGITDEKLDADIKENERFLEPMVPHPTQGDHKNARIVVLGKNPAYAPRLWREPHVLKGNNRMKERGFLGLQACWTKEDCRTKEDEKLADAFKRFYPFAKWRLFNDPSAMVGLIKSDWYIKRYITPEKSLYDHSVQQYINDHYSEEEATELYVLYRSIRNAVQLYEAYCTCNDDCKEAFTQLLEEHAEKTDAKKASASNLREVLEACIDRFKELDHLFSQLELFPYQTENERSIPYAFLENVTNLDFDGFHPLPSQLITFLLFKALLLDSIKPESKESKRCFVVRGTHYWRALIKWMFQSDAENRDKALALFDERALEPMDPQQLSITFNNLISVKQKRDLQGENSKLYEFCEEWITP